jgi:hypothetical protein
MDIINFYPIIMTTLDINIFADPIILTTTDINIFADQIINVYNGH